MFVVAAGDLRDARERGNPNWLVDMTPDEGVGDAALAVGKPFADRRPGGPKFTVISADATKAVIQVELWATAPASRARHRPVQRRSAVQGAGPRHLRRPPSGPALAAARDRRRDGSGGAGGGGGTGGAGGTGGRARAAPAARAAVARAGPADSPTGGLRDAAPTGADAEEIQEPDAGATTPPVTVPVPGSCNCRVSGRPERPGSALLVGALGLFLGLRRRSRRAR